MSRKAAEFKEKAKQQLRKLCAAGTALGIVEDRLTELLTEDVCKTNQD